MKQIEYLIETDILIDHLTTNSKTGKTDLELAMRNGICFTTVINSSELYYSVNNEFEKSAVDDLMRSIKVLGLHARYSLKVCEFTGKVSSLRDAIISTVSKINKLPVLTNKLENYKFAGIEIIDPKTLRG